MSSNTISGLGELEKMRTRARMIRERLTTLGFKAGLQQAYEILAAAEGKKNWATLKSSFVGNQTKVDPDIRTADFWNSVDQLSPVFPSLLMGGGRHGRARLLRATSAALNEDVVTIQVNRCEFGVAFLDRIKRTARNRGVVVYVDIDEEPTSEFVGALCRWMEKEMFHLVVGAEDPSILPQALLRRFVSRHKVSDRASRIPTEFDFKNSGTFTIFARTSQAEVDADMREYASLSLEMSTGIVLGDIGFERDIAMTFPRRSHMIATSTWMQANSKPDTSLWKPVLENEYDHVWVQNLEEYRFTGYETWSSKTEGAMMFAYMIGMAPCGGMTAKTKGDLFRKIVKVFPHMIWETVPTNPERCRQKGLSTIRISYEGEDCSEQFLRWVRAVGFTFENGVVSPSADDAPYPQ